MTWYASHIYAQALPSVQSIFAAHPILSNGLYLINHLDGHEWPVLQNPRWNFVHGLPPGGLLVVRELCPPSGEEFVWQRGKSFNWDSPDLFSADETAELAKYPIIHLSRLPSSEFGNLHFDSKWAGIHPPDRLLGFLKYVSVTTGTAVCFYHHANGANQGADQELAWVFGDEDWVYIAHDPEPYAISRITHTGSAQILEPKRNLKAVLPFVMEHFGLEMPTTYFAPHTRKFPWNQYKV